MKRGRAGSGRVKGVSGAALPLLLSVGRVGGLGLVCCMEGPVAPPALQIGASLSAVMPVESDGACGLVGVVADDGFGVSPDGPAAP